MSEFRRKLMMANASKDGGGILPSGYTQLQWIEAGKIKSINDYKISTKVQISNTLRLKAKCNFTSENRGYKVLFISDRQNGNKSYGFLKDSYSGQIQWNNDFYNTPNFIDLNKDILLELNKGKFSVDNKTIHQFAEGNFRAGELYLFNDVRYKTYAHAPTILYYLKLYDNNILIRDYIPCINPQKEIGLYDIVEGKFYPNEGSEKFIAGDIA